MCYAFLDCKGQTCVLKKNLNSETLFHKEIRRSQLQKEKGYLTASPLHSETPRPLHSPEMPKPSQNLLMSSQSTFSPVMPHNSPIPVLMDPIHDPLKPPPSSYTPVMLQNSHIAELKSQPNSPVLPQPLIHSNVQPLLHFSPLLPSSQQLSHFTGKNKNNL
jgi:hypothetical protein